jgi:tetratricopeptide (TPR) repeat protein
MNNSKSTSFKVYFNDEIHRVSIASATPTLSQVHDTIKSIFETKLSDSSSLIIQYIDDDNDKITVSTEQEWTEALHALQDANIKKIYVSEHKIQKAASCHAPMPKLWTPDVLIHISPPQRKDATRELAHKIAEGQNVDLPTESRLKQNLRLILHQLSLNFINSKEYGKAVNVLKAALQMFPTSHIDLYNLACTNALMGDKNEACQNLKRATENGYRNVTHIKRDSDLESIRDMPEYQEIVSVLQGKMRSIEVKARLPANFLSKVKSTLLEPQVKKEEIKEEEGKAVPVVEVKQEEKPQEVQQKQEVKPQEEIKVKVEAEKPQAEVEAEAPEDKYKEQKKQLIDMGFGEDMELLDALLIVEDGDVEAVAALMMGLDD